MKTHYLKQTTLLLFLSALMLHCSESVSENATTSDGVYTFHADSVGQEVQRDSLMHYVSSVQLVPLETIENSTISIIREIAVSDDYIYILDSRLNASIKIFDRMGNFVKGAGGSGKGPGEYTFPRGIDWNEEQQTLYVGDKSMGKIIRYDASGNFIDEIQLSDSLRNFATFIATDAGNFLIPVQKYPDGDENGFVALVSQEGTIIKRYFQEEGIATNLVNADNILRRIGDRILYTPSYSDIVYSFDQQEEVFSPYIKIESSHPKDLELFQELEMEVREVNLSRELRNNPQLRFEKTQEIRGKYLPVNRISNLIETPEVIHFMFRYEGAGGIHFALLDKMSGSVKNANLDFPQGFNISAWLPTTDFLIGSLRWSNRPDISEGRIETMIDLIKDTATEKEIEQIRSLTLEDNPVLAFFYFD